MSQLLVIPEIKPLPSLAVTEAAGKKKESLIISASEITAIPTDATRDRAIAVASLIKKLLKEVEAARVEAKLPFRTTSEAIDDLARNYRRELTMEAERLGFLVGDYEEGRQKRIRDEEETLEQHQLRLAQEATKETPPDATAEERGTALERAVEAEQGIDMVGGRIAALRSTVEAAKATGGALRHDWQIAVTDIVALYEAYPQCVELKPRLLAIKDLLRIGLTPPGVTVKTNAIFTARASK